MASTELSRKEHTALIRHTQRLWEGVTLRLQCVIGENHPPETVTQFREGVQRMHQIAVTVANQKALAAYEVVRKSKLTKMKNKLEREGIGLFVVMENQRPLYCLVQLGSRGGT